jgi:hypothetical protein
MMEFIINNNNNNNEELTCYNDVVFVVENSALNGNAVKVN